MTTCTEACDAEKAVLLGALREIEALPVNQALVRRVEVEAHVIAHAALADISPAAAALLAQREALEEVGGREGC